MSDTTLSAVWGELAHPIRQDHPGEGKPPWKDNGYLVFWAPERAVYGVVHVSTSMNAEGRRARASFSIRGQVTEIVEELDPGTWTSKSIRYAEDGHSVEIDSPGLRASLAIAPRGRHADYNQRNVLPALVEGEAPQHFQRAVTVRGSVTVSGVPVDDVVGAGMRDRTWGYRDESRQFPEYYGLIVDIGGRLLTVMKFAQADGSSITDGFVLSDEDPVRVESITGLRRDPAGLFAQATTATVGGAELTLRLTARRAGFWIPMGWEREGPTMSAFDELIEVVTPAGEIGHGLFEQGIVRRLC